MTDAAKDATTKVEPDKTDSKSLNDLLADWDEPKKETKAETTELQTLKDQVKSLTEAEGERTYKAEMQSTVIPIVKGDLKVDNDFVEFWVNKQAVEDPRLQKLWDARGENPKAFKDAITALAPEFKKYAESKNLTKVDSKKTASNSLAAAVKTARDSDTTSSTMDDVDFGSLSDSEFALKKAEVFRLTKANKL